MGDYLETNVIPTGCMQKGGIQEIQVPTTQLAYMSIDHKSVELTADVNWSILI